ncbi:MAG: type I-E CRISPR-associated protein Cas6/Cse3/CasE [Dehalococcoidia bacterium]|nr:type I-E CRISPR-associated protein Cas6/Cse3/CasE [Dehalococcoidia bacterium]
MYLSRLLLNPRHRDVQRDLSDLQAMHRTLMAAFPLVQDAASARAELGVLYRLETDLNAGSPAILVQSGTAPQWSALPSGYLSQYIGADQQNPAFKELEPLLAALKSGMSLRFRLRANPTKKVATKTGEDGRKRNGTRADLRDEEAQRAWLHRKGEHHGFVVLGVRLADEPLQTGRHRGQGEARRLTVASVLYNGILRVTDLALFQEALESGIGPAKAYGCGLLSVGPIA